MMSGPEPTFAATAALGRTSSQLSLSTRTSTPVRLVNAAVFFSHRSSSPCTKRFQRSTRSLAPFSGLHAVCALATSGTPPAAPAAMPAETFRKSLRFMLLMVPSFGWMVLGEPVAARAVEKESVPGLETHRLARPEGVALAHHGGDVHAVHLAEYLRVSAGRLHHHDLGAQFPRLAAAGDVQVLGTHADQHVAAVAPLRQQIHRGRADEARDILVRRIVVELERRTGLLDAARVHHHDLVGHGHRLDLVVRDVDRGRLEALVQRLDLGAHRHAQLRVEVGERLVEEKHLWLSHDRPSHRDALALAARELPRIAVQVVLEPEDDRGLLDALARLVFRFAGELQAE